MSNNPIMDGLLAYRMVDDVFRKDRAEERQGAIDTRNQAWQDEQRGALREDRAREKDLRETKAELYRLEGELSPEIGNYTTDYFHPEHRAKDKPYLGDAIDRLDSGNLDHDFFLDYTNTIYGTQINRGTGGVKKRASKIGMSPDGKGIVVGLDVTDGKGSVRKEMRTVNRGTREDGDDQVKVIPVSDLVRDNIQRQIVIDTFDRHGVGEGSPAEQRQRTVDAVREVKARLLELGDTSVAQRDQGRGAEARKIEQAYALEDHKHAHNLEVKGIENENAIRVARIKNQPGGNGSPYDKEAVKQSLASYHKMLRNIADAEAGKAVVTTDALTGEPVTRKPTYEEIDALKAAAKSEHDYLVKMGALPPQDRQPAPTTIPAPTDAVAGQPPGTRLEAGRPTKDGRVAYPIIDLATGKPYVNPKTGKAQLHVTDGSELKKPALSTGASPPAVADKPPAAPAPAQPSAALPVTPKQQGKNYGTRNDGTPKGPGWFGEIRTKDGRVMTELTIGVQMGGKETEVPLLVPTLSRQDVSYLASGGSPTKNIIQKAVSFAEGRIKQGRSPFIQPGEKPASLSSMPAPTISPDAAVKPVVDYWNNVKTPGFS